MGRYRTALSCALIALILFVHRHGNVCRGDALVVVRAMKATTIAEIFVEESTVRLELEIDTADLRGFKNLLPDELYEKAGHPPLPLGTRLKEFVRKDFVIKADGTRLDGRLTKIEVRNRVKRDEISGEPLPVLPGEEEMVVFAIFEYPLKSKPKALTFTPPLDAGGSATATIGFVAYHQGLAINDFRYLSGPVTVDLDWDDPWYSQFRKRNLWRQYRQPISAFIYVEPFEVRKEIIVRPKDLQQWLDLGIRDKDIIKANVQEAMKKKIADFFSKRHPVHINGKEAVGTLDRIHFLRRTLRMTSVIDPPEDIPVHCATLGIIFVYPIEGLPKKVTMQWDLFNDRIQKINAATVDEAGGFPYALEPNDSVLRWQNFLKNPTIPSFATVPLPAEPKARPLLLVSSALAFVMVGLFIGKVRKRSLKRSLPATIVGSLVLVLAIWLLMPLALGNRPADADAQDITLGLLKNVYRAFDYRQEGVIYDALARSVTGDLLTQTYLEVQSALALASQGGAKVKVKQVDLKDARIAALEDGPGFASHCSWVVTGSVGHWGHVHKRRNAYEAILRIKPVDGVWKISDLDLQSEQRL